MSARPRILLLNPNTDEGVTRDMVAVARAAGPQASIDGITAPFGAPLITSAEALRVAGEAVSAMCRRLAGDPPDGVIIAAFGDPGLEAARMRLRIPVVGIAEAAMLAAAAAGTFSIVTTTPELAEPIAALAGRYGCGEKLRSVRITDAAPALVMSDPVGLVEALAVACESAIRHDGVEAIVIGGGPLAVAARKLRFRIGVPIIEPIPCAVAWILALIVPPS